MKVVSALEGLICLMIWLIMIYYCPLEGNALHDWLMALKALRHDWAPAGEIEDSMPNPKYTAGG